MRCRPHSQDGAGRLCRDFQKAVLKENTSVDLPAPALVQEAQETQKQEESTMSEIDLNKLSLEELQSKIKHCEWGLELFEEKRLAREGGLFNTLKSILLSIKNYNFCGTPKLELFMFESEEGLRYKLEQYKAELKRRE